MKYPGYSEYSIQDIHPVELCRIGYPFMNIRDKCRKSILLSYKCKVLLLEFVTLSQTFKMLASAGNLGEYGLSDV
jgi:hypothetical protein